jgi:hypothetical protein
MKKFLTAIAPPMNETDLAAVPASVRPGVVQPCPGSLRRKHIRCCAVPRHGGGRAHFLGRTSRSRRLLIMKQQRMSRARTTQSRTGECASDVTSVLVDEFREHARSGLAA